MVFECSHHWVSCLKVDSIISLYGLKDTCCKCVWKYNLLSHWVNDALQKLIFSFPFSKLCLNPSYNSLISNVYVRLLCNYYYYYFVCVCGVGVKSIIIIIRCFKNVYYIWRSMDGMLKKWIWWFSMMKIRRVIVFGWKRKGKSAWYYNRKCVTWVAYL